MSVNGYLVRIEAGFCGGNSLVGNDVPGLTVQVEDVVVVVQILAILPSLGVIVGVESLGQEEVRALSSVAAQIAEHDAAGGVPSAAGVHSHSDLIERHGVGRISLEHLSQAVVLGLLNIAALAGHNDELGRVVENNIDIVAVIDRDLNRGSLELYVILNGVGVSIDALGSGNVIRIVQAIGGRNTDIVEPSGIVGQSIVNEAEEHRKVNNFTSGDIDELSRVSALADVAVVSGGGLELAGEEVQVGNTLLGEANVVAVIVEQEGVSLANGGVSRLGSKSGPLNDSAVSQSDSAGLVGDALDSAGHGAGGVDVVLATLNKEDNRRILVDLADVSPEVSSLYCGGLIGLVVSVVQVSHTALSGNTQLSKIVLEGDASIALVVSAVVDEVVLIVDTNFAKSEGIASNLGGVGRDSSRNGSARSHGGLREVVHKHGDTIDSPDAGRVVHHVDAGVGVEVGNQSGASVALGQGGVLSASALVGSDDAGVGNQAEHILAQGGADAVDGGVALDAVDVAGDVGAVSNLLNVGQHVESVQSGLLTGQSDVISTGEVALEQIDSVSNLSGVDAPAGAGELALHAEANSAEEHLGPLEAGQLRGRLEGGLGHAVDDALLNAVGNVAGGPTGGSDVLEGSGRALQAVGLVLAQLHVGNDLGSLLTGVVALGLESRLGHAVDDADAGQDTYRLIIRIADLAHVVGEVFDLIVGRGADHAETKNHGDHEYEAQGLLESSHCGNSSFE